MAGVVAKRRGVKVPLWLELIGVVLGPLALPIAFVLPVDNKAA